jgi:glucose-1-phosphate adenylyltransferase
MNSVLAIIMAGGEGERLRPLTIERSKAAVPFAGKFRLIDFTLSNCVNSGLRQMFILTQYRSESLLRHIQEGWGISSSGLGDFIYCVPAQQKLGMEWYRGTADAVRQNLNLLKHRNIQDVLILSGDHIYKMNYQQLVDFHRSSKASLTVCAVRERKERAARMLGVLEAGPDNRLVGFVEKPEQPRVLADAPDYALASMGIYIFKSDTLLDVLQGSGEDFGKHVIPGMIGKDPNMYVYDYQKNNKIQDFKIEVRDGIREKVLVDQTRDSGYWKDVGTIDSYYEASMDLVDVDPQFNLYGERWPIRTYQRPLPPTKYVIGGKTPQSIVSDGCIISDGTVWSSVLSPGVIVERDAVVEQSVVFDDVMIEPGARIKRAIIDKQCRIRAGASVGYDHEADKRSGCTVSERGITVVPKDAVISRTDPALF